MSFFVSTVSFFGFVDSEGNIQMNPSKFKVVVDWPTPGSCKQLQRFNTVHPGLEVCSGPFTFLLLV